MAVSILINGEQKLVADVIPTGMITLISDVTKIYTGSDWLECDGSAVSRSTYADLFAAISTTFGSGDGVSTFNLPNASPTIVSGAQTFSAFIAETVIKVNNPSPISIDISAGAAQAGIRVSIIEESTQGVTIYTDAAHEQSCVLPKGMILLEWDGSQWCLIGEAVRIVSTITSSGIWKTPFSATYTFRVLGGGGGGGSANVHYPTTQMFAGGGAGGSYHQFTKYEPAGTDITISIGEGGIGGFGGFNPTNGGNGGNTTLSDGVFTLYGMGGLGGHYDGTGGSAQVTPTSQIPYSFSLGGYNGGNGTQGISGAGGNPPYWLGTAGIGVTNNNGNPGGNYGAGGSGAHLIQVAGDKHGGAGAPGVVYIEF